MSRHPFHGRGRRILVDRFRIEDILKTKGLYRRHLSYQWEYFSEVAFQRAQIFEDLKSSLLDHMVGPFKIERWQRAVKYQYALSPLSAQGSLREPGGRFNIGQIDARFPAFPALYIAQTKETAMDELLSRNSKGELLSTEELALARTASMTVVAVSGELESVFDLRNEKNLTAFVERTRHFTLSDHLKRLANGLKVDPPRIIGTVSELSKHLLDPTWRYLPMQMDIPSNSQIFGQLVMEAGIDGILFPSVLSGEDCLAIFPKCFARSSSYLELADPAPKETKCIRLDSKSIGQLL